MPGKPAKSGLPGDRKERVAWTTEATDTIDLAQRYDAWSETYERDLVELDGYHQIIAEAKARVASLFPETARIAELGCGTGLLGKALGDAGFGNLLGFDLSEKMLAKAAITGSYRYLRQANLNDGIPLADNSVDGVIAVGTLTYLEPAIMDEVLRVLRPEGVFFFSYQPAVHEARGFAALESRLVQSGRLTTLLNSNEVQPLPVSYPAAQFRFKALKKVDYFGRF